ncbi:hypothetical protein DI09_190p30 [Mitosporidium daphniae]|uniref:Ubiquitin-like protease family profile domain-containing protein n=1 Tax=Mitosporidium daphniae TaxID=1485682 RepID=A0A098VT71_9MICR|nr:uncharacterized protein DI09_190p30 [Mitosporidium daphniae]KGG52293.1 hypothetical protein DI09_190p30 [Mitosporidium daphniae]|eukprot:XP_013238729.1 uncharacterized protein DI09_190p30 [Mitosporidium daphniae]
MVAELSGHLSKKRPIAKYGFPRVYPFNSFFYPKLVLSGHSSVRRWTKKVDLFSDFDLILIPINTSNTHWSLAIVDLHKQSLYYLDSMNGHLRGTPLPVSYPCS